MLLKVLIERHGLLDDLLVQLRGIEQVQSILPPHGEAQMGNVETGLVAGDGNDVAIVDGLTHRLRVLHFGLGDEAELHARDALLHFSDIGHILGVRLQGLVALRVLTHIVDFDGLYRGKGRIGLLNLADDAGLRVGHNPIGEIMDARGVCIDDPIVIAHIAEVIQESCPSELFLIGTEREGRDRLYQRGAVEFIDIDDELLGIVDFKRMGDIRHIEELAGKKEREASLIGTLLAGIFEQGLDENAVVGLLGFIGVIGVLRVIRRFRRLGILG